MIEGGLGKFFGDHLGELFRFSGREGQRPFWIWVGLNVIAHMIFASVLFGGRIDQSIAKMEQFAKAHPDEVIRTVGPGGYSITVKGHHPELMPDFADLLTWYSLGAAISVFLLAAAIVRRLHDSDRSGFWSLMPLPFLFGGFVMMGHLFAQMESKDMPSMFLFGGVMVNNLIYLLLLGFLIALCMKPGTPGENHFGPQPG